MSNVVRSEVNQQISASSNITHHYSTGEVIERLKRLLNGSPSQPLGPKPRTALAQAAAKETKRHEEDRRNEVLLLFLVFLFFFYHLSIVCKLL